MHALIAGTLCACGTLLVLACGSSSSPERPLAAERSGDADPAVAPPRPQRSAGTIEPRPNRATADKSRMYYDGCQAEAREVRSKRCVYGVRRAKKTVVLFGDSHALMYFPAFNRLAKQRGWRLVALAKVGCPPFDQLVYNRRVGRGYRECLRWHRYVLKRLRKGKPDLIATSGWIWHKAMQNGKIVPRGSARNRRLLRQGYARMLRKLRQRTGAKVVIMKDIPKAPGAVPPCVARSRKRLGRCAFRISPGHNRQSFEGAVRKRVPHAHQVNLAPVFCPKRRCHAVINGRLVYRDGNHLTATYAATLRDQLGARLPQP